MRIDLSIHIIYSSNYDEQIFSLMFLVKRIQIKGQNVYFNYYIQ